MKTKPVSIPPDTRPRAVVFLYQDGNGNWFASVESEGPGRISCWSTATYTTAAEAMAEVAQWTRWDE